MSLMPYLLNDLLNDIQRPSLHDQHFGLGILPGDLLQPEVSVLSVPLHSGYVRPWRHMTSNNSGISNIVNDRESFKINLDVQQFRPEELSVKVVEDFIVVEGKHEERSDEHGFVSRQFTRRYKIPANVDKDALKSHLSSDGVLQLVAPKIQAQPESAGRSIPIVRTNQPAMKQQSKKTIEQNGTSQQNSTDNMES